MNSEPIKILQIGIGGYGGLYTQALLSLEASGTTQLAAIIDPIPKNAIAWPQIQARRIPVFTSLDDFLESGIQIDLAVVASPISFHADQSCALLAAGINVLCEKPLAATVAEAERMQAARNASGKFLEVGYQWSFSPVIQALKTDILAGRFGRPQTLLTRVGWPRPDSYYTRNSWAGRIHNDQGQPVYDSPVNNATAHFLHNMLFVLGDAQDRSATPTAITAECYRVNPIENYDTACCRIETQEGPEIYFYTTHAIETDDGPVFRYIFEEAEIRYTNGEDIIAHFKDGRTHNYGNPEADHLHKLNACVAKCHAPTPSPTICSVEAAAAHTICVGALQQIPTHTITAEYQSKKTIEAGNRLTFLPNMAENLRAAYDQQKLFSEMNYPWAHKAESVTIFQNPTVPTQQVCPT